MRPTTEEGNNLVDPVLIIESPTRPITLNLVGIEVAANDSKVATKPPTLESRPMTETLTINNEPPLDENTLNGLCFQILPGYGELELDEPTLSDVLDSLIPFVRGNKNITKLPVYKGKSMVGSRQDSEVNSSRVNSGEGKEFAWTRGVGIELSPLKTRSSQKKLASHIQDKIDFSSSPIDGGPLRAVKAQAWEK